jgi:hypothetical protein
MSKKYPLLQFFHSPGKSLVFTRTCMYVLHMFKILLFSLLFVSNVASASCLTEAFERANLDQYSISYTPTSGFPNDLGEVEVNVEVRGSTYGGMVILCDMINDKFLKFVSEFREIGQN